MRVFLYVFGHYSTNSDISQIKKTPASADAFINPIKNQLEFLHQFVAGAVFVVQVCRVNAILRVAHRHQQHDPFVVWNVKGFFSLVLV